MSFNADETTSPPWMDISFFEKVLTSAENNKTTKVSAIDIKPATKVGDHFASVIYRIKITYSNDKTKGDIVKSVILKTTPYQEGVKKDFVGEFPLFEVETKMYLETLDPMARLLKEAGETFTLAPQMLYHSFDPAPIIVFEDLAEKGYGMFPKHLDLESAIIVFKRLAKFHAASLQMHNSNHDLEQYKPSTDNAVAAMIFQENYVAFTEVVKTWPGCEEIAEKLENMKDDFSKIGKRVYAVNTGPDAYNVLNHCDFNYKNLLARFDENEKIEDLILIDFQICNWASPAVDLLYGLYMMVSTETRMNHRDEIIKEYHAEFVSSLKKLGYLGKVPSLTDLQVELLKKGELELSMCVCMLPFLFVDFTKYKMEDFFSLNQIELKKGFYQDEGFKATMLVELKRMLYKGFLQ